VTPEHLRRAVDWLDPLKGLALAWIFVNHLSEHLLGSPFFANPDADWPPLADRIGQLAPVSGTGWADLPLNLFRYIGWTGDQGVQVFLILSGFGLAWGLAGRAAGSLSTAAFYRRRLARIYPTWWAAHLALIALAAFFGWFRIRDPAVPLSLLGIRILPDHLYALTPAWWFVGLLLQLYLVFPWLWRLLVRVGPARFLLLVLGLSFVIRGAGLLYFDGYLDAWSRGAIFVTRLPEFAFGMALASWMGDRPAATAERLSSGRAVLGAVLLYPVGIALSLDLAGMAFAPFVLGLSAFVLLLAGLTRVGPAIPGLCGALRWVGLHSYALYLTHQPCLEHLVPRNGLRAAGVGTMVAIAATVASALLLERAVALAGSSIRAARAAGRLRRLAVWTALMVLATLAVVLGLEHAVRAADPREPARYGWGERRALQPHPLFGWNLVPDRSTRLRWESYDYVVEANALGFPGPAYEEVAPTGALRILTLGDAFTSAEGVDTGLSWPRQLEDLLRERLPDRQVQVLNFAITGHGPEQYAAVAAAFVPRFRPDLVLVGFFVNEYQDVLISTEAFHHSIGFGEADPESWIEQLRPAHLHRWVEVEWLEPLAELLYGTPRAYGYFLGHFAAFDRRLEAQQAEAGVRVREHLARIAEVCAAAGARPELLLVPASIQVADPADLAYHPRAMRLDDPRFDPELPQRRTREIAAALGLACVDLRPALRELGGSACQPRNMHWTAAGHRRVAAFVAEHLIEEGLLNGR
jgi:peptidoglycan/LPS O-acetylase OafA/YrhL